MPLWVMRLYAWWKLRPVDGAPKAERFYDPVPTVAGLDVPSLWIFGGEDHSMPTYWSIDRLVPLRAAGRPIEILLYPEADHGILRFEEMEDGARRMLGYEPGYLATQVAWLRFQSGLDRFVRAGGGVGVVLSGQARSSGTRRSDRPTRRGMTLPQATARTRRGTGPAARSIAPRRSPAR